MIYQHGNTKIIIEENIENFFLNYRQTKNKNEQGGILLGIVKLNEIIICRASIPTVFDKSSRFSFERNKKSAQLFIDYEFLNSGGKIIYLGEWHTHPENFPTPSNVDLKMIKTQYNKNSLNENFLIMIIVGIKEKYVSFFDGTNNNPLSAIKA